MINWSANIRKLDCTITQKNMLQLIQEYEKGWVSVEALEKEMEKVFLDKKQRTRGA